MGGRGGEKGREGEGREGGERERERGEESSLLKTLISIEVVRVLIV
jgi:hypothetical protein